ncbi:MAG: sulfur carrier protein ThiS [Candidatus Cloacimonetes bacterium]|jgi:sulfur carrier protein|nr:sulfur carrier protein ThiS [Candidatus Cloacimonadota bacterium]MBT6994809.1 sulfur carrier protein ThiS [Candidatus Cloacimonadota bacterium]MBT7470181.1 sulfur carrier protein ThiS [Candidatus Cloacimonadota bacterium]
MVVNGKKLHFETQISVVELLVHLNLNDTRIVVELNKKILPKTQFTNTILTDSDEIEIVGFVGGG